MIILIGLLVVLCIGLFLLYSDISEFAGGLMTCIAAAFLLITLSVWPIEYYDIKAQIQKFKAVQQTIERARNADKYIESAAFQLKIAESNQWLAGRQYWNGTIFDIFIPDEVDSLEPIE